MNYTERVDGFQITDVMYIGLPPKDTPPRFQVVKWYDVEPHEGWVYHKEDETWKPRWEKITEGSYAVACLEWDPHEPQFVFRSYGTRWLEEKPTEAVVKMILDFCEKKEKELTEI